MSERYDKPAVPNDRGQQSDEADPPTRERAEHDDDQLFVVGLGASAGGLSAIEELLAHVPEDSGLSYVVVVHLSPDHESHLEEVLAPRARVPVQQVTETTQIEPDHVYLIPPNANLDVIDTHLRLTELESERGRRAPIDHFFRTLADGHGRRSIGVVLTGTGSDGTLGLRQIKERGGLTLVQDPAEADFDGMPRSAIANAPIDLVLPLSEIVGAAMRYASTSPLLELHADEPSSELLQFLQDVYAQVRARTGRDFNHYKRSTMVRRIARRMQVHQLREPFSYLDLLRERPEEAHALADDLLVTVTNFFRNPAVFETLAQNAIPGLFEGKGPDDCIRVWSVGCATGEEAYSLAILLTEEADRHDNPPTFQVFATDLHEPSLEIGRQGLFPGDIVADVSPERLHRFFRREDSAYRVSKELRESIMFAPHNLLADPPFAKLDLISCRNLLIYLRRDIHNTVAELFHYALVPGGLLLLGTADSLSLDDLFVAEDKKIHLFRKHAVAAQPRLPRLPLAHSRATRSVGSRDLTRRKQAASYPALHQQILAQHGSPSLLVGPNDDVLHVLGPAGRYLVQPEGPLTSSVFKLVREELRIDLFARLPEVRHGKQAVRIRPVPVRIEGRVVPVTVRLQPAEDDGQSEFVVIQFEEREVSPDRPGEDRQGLEPAGEDDDRRPLEQLQTDNRALKEQLQHSIEEHETSREELKTSNEELQSANEELRATLEELETSKEELQSINEELRTVNQENRHKVEELAELSDDLHNLLVATDIGTLFLDRELRILRFTPKFADLSNVRSTDRGRPITDLTSKIGYQDLASDARAVLRSLVPTEREIQGPKGRWHLTRVLPYRTSDDRIAGVVVTFVDITRPKEAESDVRRAKAAAERIIDALPHPLLVLRGDLRVYSANASFYDHFRVEAEDTLGQHLYTLGNRQWDIPELHELLEDTLANQRSFDDYLVERDFEGIGRRSMLLNGRQLADMNLILLGIHDITSRHEMERALRESEERLSEENRNKDEYLAMLGHELRNPLGALRSASELLLAEPTDKPGVRRAHDVLARQTSHMSRIIDGLLDVSRIARGKVHLSTGPVELHDVLEGVLDMRRRHLEERGLELLTDFAPEPLWVTGDEARLVQIFDNIIGNAIRFTEPPGTVTVSLSRDASSADIRVRDTGVGIRRELLPRLFDPFRQESQDSARTTGGLGLGLSLVKGLVELHRGSVAAHSDGPGRGAEIEVSLPLASAPNEPNGKERGADATARRILIVEDNADAADMLQGILELAGHEVSTARDGAAALEALRSRGADAVLCDIGLPKMSGYELARVIRGDASIAKLPLLAVSGYGQPEDRKKAMEAGFDDHLVKPVDAKAVDAALRRLDSGRKG